MNVLAIAAHPDDAELGCFGTLLEMLRAGHNVYAVALAPGGYGTHSRSQIQTAWARAKEVLKTAARSGRSDTDYVVAKFPIGRLEHNWESVGFVDSLISEFRIDGVITHHYGEAHQDHLAAQRIAVSAARRKVDSLLLWESSIYTHRNVFPFRTQVYVPVSEVAFDGKIAALEPYLSAGLLDQDEVEAHRFLARYRGAEMHRKFAEAFEVVWQVYGSETIPRVSSPKPARNGQRHKISQSSSAHAE